MKPRLCFTSLLPNNYPVKERADENGYNRLDPSSAKDGETARSAESDLSKVMIDRLWYQELLSPQPRGSKKGNNLTIAHEKETRVQSPSYGNQPVWTCIPALP